MLAFDNSISDRAQLITNHIHDIRKLYKHACRRLHHRRVPAPSASLCLCLHSPGSLEIPCPSSHLGSHRASPVARLSVNNNSETPMGVMESRVGAVPVGKGLHGETGCILMSSVSLEQWPLQAWTGQPLWILGGIFLRECYSV